MPRRVARITLSTDGWLELSIECDPEAAEAISERLGRLAPSGTSAEPASPPPIDGDALGPVYDPTAPVRIRAWLPDSADNRAAAEGLANELERFAAFSGGGVGLRVSDRCSFDRSPPKSGQPVGAPSFRSSELAGSSFVRPGANTLPPQTTRS